MIFLTPGGVLKICCSLCWRHEVLPVNRKHGGWCLDHINQWCDLCMASRSKSIQVTSCKNVKTLPRKNDLSCFKSLLITGLWDIILTSLLPSIQSCSSKFWVRPCIASNFDNGWRGGHKHKIMDRPFMAKYGSVSSTFATGCSPFHFPYQLSDVQVKTSEAQKYLRVLGTFFNNIWNGTPMAKCWQLVQRLI